MTPEQVEAYKRQRLDEVGQAVGTGLAGSAAGRYTEFESAEALKTPLAALRSWDDFFKDGPAVSEDFGSTNMRCTECIFEHYPLEGDDVCIAIFCSRCGQPRLFTK